MSKIEDMRHEYHKRVAGSLIYMKRGNAPSMADIASKSSKAISLSLVKGLGVKIAKGKTEGQTAGKGFEDLTRDFLRDVFEYL